MVGVFFLLGNGAKKLRARCLVLRRKWIAWSSPHPLLNWGSQSESSSRILLEVCDVFLPHPSKLLNHCFNLYTSFWHRNLPIWTELSDSSLPSVPFSPGWFNGTSPAASNATSASSRASPKRRRRRPRPRPGPRPKPRRRRRHRRKHRVPAVPVGQKGPTKRDTTRFHRAKQNALVWGKKLGR